MGCCLTTTAAAVDDHCQLDNSKTISEPRGAPPPPLGFEEETVKEVLSETPIFSKKPPPSNSTPTKIPRDNQQILHPVEEFRSGNDVVQFTKNPIEENASVVSSEMYTYSESFSAATTTTSLATDLTRGEIGTGIEINEGEVTQKAKKLPPAKMVRRRQPTSSVERARRKERGIRPPPPPPARRSAVPSTYKKVQLPSRNITTAQRHRNVVPSNVVRREPPARRSRSPAIRGEAGQLRKVKERSPAPKAGNRVPVTSNEENFKLKKTTDDGVLPVPETETYESLENPLVSLECFIFL